jgi:hypothetical protein
MAYVYYTSEKLDFMYHGRYLVEEDRARGLVQFHGKEDAEHFLRNHPNGEGLNWEYIKSIV